MGLSPLSAVFVFELTCTCLVWDCRDSSQFQAEFWNLDSPEKKII